MKPQGIAMLTVFIILLVSTVNVFPQEEPMVTLYLKNEKQANGALDKARGQIISDDGSNISVKLKDGSILEFPGSLVERISTRCTPTASELVNHDVIATINSYKRLRSDTSNENKDRRKLLGDVLDDLGWELGHPPYTKEDIVALIGEPDAIWSPDMIEPYLGIYQQEQNKSQARIEQSKPTEYLIYLWRGWHDFMFYIIANGKVIDHGWWFAYER